MNWLDVRLLWAATVSARRNAPEVDQAEFEAALRAFGFDLADRRQVYLIVFYLMTIMATIKLTFTWRYEEETEVTWTYSRDQFNAAFNSMLRELHGYVQAALKGAPEYEAWPRQGWPTSQLQRAAWRQAMADCLAIVEAPYPGMMALEDQIREDAGAAAGQISRAENLYRQFSYWFVVARLLEKLNRAGEKSGRTDDLGPARQRLGVVARTALALWPEA